MVNISTRNQDELSRILDSCLDQITDGTETVESVLERYPKYKEQLRPALEAAQWLQSRSEVFNPRPGFVELSHRRLVNRFKANQDQLGSPAGNPFSWIPAFFQERRLVVQYTALVALTAVLLFVGYQSTSFLIQRSIPGDPLYETKLAQEELQVTLASSEEGQTRLRINFAQRRVIEMQELVMAGREDHLSESMSNFEFQMTEAASGIKTMAMTDETGAAVLAAEFEETLTVPVKNLVGILDTTSVFASAVFIDTFQTLTAEIFDGPVLEPVLVLATTTPTSTFTATLTPTMVFTATFTPTFTPTKLPTTAPTQEAIEPTATDLPTNTPVPTEPPPPPPPTETEEPRVNPTPTATLRPTSAPTPTNPPANTPAPEPTTPPEPTPEKTKKPKPTQHPTYQPTDVP